MKTERNLWLILVAALVLVALHLQLCSRPKPCPEAPPPVVRVDTVWAPVKDSTGWKRPKPVKELKAVAAAPNVQYVSNDSCNHDTGIVADYYATRDYSDTNETTYGKVIVQNTVNQNKITAQRVLTDFVLPEVTKTQYLPQNRTELYYSIVAQGSRTNPLSGAGGGLMLRLKNGMAIEVDALLNLQGQVLYQASYKGKISFRK